MLDHVSLLIDHVGEAIRPQALRKVAAPSSAPRQARQAQLQGHRHEAADFPDQATHAPLRPAPSLADLHRPLLHDLLRRLRRRLWLHLRQPVEGSGYDPHAFAIGASFLFALACLGLATLSFRLRWVRQKMKKARAAQRGAGRPQLGTAGGRAARPQPVRIAGRPDRAARRRRPHHLRQRRLLRTGRNCRAKNWSAAVLRSTCWSRATPRSKPTAQGSTTRRSRPRSARAGSPGAKA